MGERRRRRGEDARRVRSPRAAMMGRSKELCVYKGRRPRSSGGEASEECAELRREEKRRRFLGRPVERPGRAEIRVAAMLGRAPAAFLWRRPC